MHACMLLHSYIVVLYFLCGLFYVFIYIRKYPGEVFTLHLHVFFLL